MSAIILAGGKSQRMNGNKALIMMPGGVTLIEKIAGDIKPYFREILIVTRPGEELGFLPYRIIVDEQPDQGPLMGILSGLRASVTEINFVIACDIPEINFHFLEIMISNTERYRVVVPVTGQDKFEPLFAFYHRSLIPDIEELLEQDQRKVSKIFSKCPTKYVPMEDTGWYLNLNTAEKYHAYLRIRKTPPVSGPGHASLKHERI